MASSKIQEDDPRWDWRKMGNKRRGGVYIGGRQGSKTVGVKKMRQLNKRGLVDWSRTERLAPAKAKPLLSVAGQSGSRTNTTSNARSGQNYRVKADQGGNYYHVYGRGKKARRVRLSGTVAKQYGYR